MPNSRRREPRRKRESQDEAAVIAWENTKESKNTKKIEKPKKTRTIRTIKNTKKVQEYQESPRKPKKTKKTKKAQDLPRQTSFNKPFQDGRLIFPAGVSSDFKYHIECLVCIFWHT